MPRNSDEGMLIVGVDSVWMGSGWTVYQIRDLQKRISLYGSCTFNEREQNYCQPKTEVYGIFRAFKELCHRIWGVFFRLEHDAQSVAQMLKSVDDVPNAPILRWISWIRLFDFETKHVPALAFKVEDGLSRRKPSPKDQPYDDIYPEEFLDAYNDVAYGSRTHHLAASTPFTQSAKFLFDQLYIPYSNPFVQSWNGKNAQVPLISASVCSPNLPDFSTHVPSIVTPSSEVYSLFATTASRSVANTP